MKVVYVHASRYGNGARVADEFRSRMANHEQPDDKTGVVPTEEEICRFQHVRPIMIEILQHKGLVKVAEEKVYVTDLKGPLEDGWQAKVDAFACHRDDGPYRNRAGVLTKVSRCPECGYDLVGS